MEVAGRAMPVIKRLTIENFNVDEGAELDSFDDQVITAGLDRVRAEGVSFDGGAFWMCGYFASEGTPGRHDSGRGPRFSRLMT
jgi:hypothetical protein